jgi:hypothetical protein
VATTSFSPWETEFVQIASKPTYDKTSGLTTIDLDATRPLVYYHFGGPDPYAADKGDISVLINDLATDPFVSCWSGSLSPFAGL